MKTTKIVYWIFTILFGGFMIFSSIGNIMNIQEAKDLVSTHLGYPNYFIPFIGWAKLLGGLAIIIPGIPGRIKEWAYAGLFFDLIAAMYSVIAVGDPASAWMFFPLFIAFGVVSYIFYHKKLRGA
jgi:DoxX-like family